MKTLQDQYKLIQEGKGHKDVFLKEAKRMFPNKIRSIAGYDEASKTLLDSGIISENIVVIPAINSIPARKEESWETNFKKFLSEESKAEEKKVSKEVEDTQKHAYNTSDKKLQSNRLPDQYWDGIYFETKNNPGKDLEDVKKIVEKNLDKDPLYYAKNAAFGVDGIGYTTEAPGLGTPKEAKGKFKSSGYGNLKENIMISLLDLIKEGEYYEAEKKEEKKSPKKEVKKPAKKSPIADKIKEIEEAGTVAALEAKITALDEEISNRKMKLEMIEENENLAEFVNETKVNEVKREIAELEKAKEKYSKIHEKLAGKVKKEIVDETEEEA